MNSANFQTCLSAESLHKIAAAEHPPGQLKEIESHVSDCARCRNLLDLGESDPDWNEEICGILRTKPDELPTFKGQEFEDQEYEHHSLESVLRLLGPTDDPNMLGRIGPYEVVSVIGRGGMGVVFKAFEATLNRFVAIKMLLPHLAVSGAARKRFAREGQAAAAVIDDHVMPIHCVDQWQGVPYIVTQYSRGMTLQTRIHKQGPLELREALRIGMQTARGLAAAHAQGLVHRDVKPSNILLDGTVERALLTDFGLARAADDASITRTGMIAGTPQYMSPEQARGGFVDARSDLFGLGCVLYTMCTAHAPFRASNSYAILRLINDEDPRSIREINPDIPGWLCSIISKLMSKLADDRFQSAGEVAELLESCLAYVQQPESVSLPKGIPTTVSHKNLQPTKPIKSPELQETKVWAGHSARWIAAIAFGFLAIAAGIVIVLEINKGKLTISCDSDSVPIRITRGNEVVEELTITRAGATVRVAAGKYLVEIDGEFDGLEVAGGKVLLKRGTTSTVKIVQSVVAQAKAQKSAAQTSDLRSVGIALGFRRSLANLRNAKLKLRRAEERLAPEIESYRAEVRAAELELEKEQSSFFLSSGVTEGKVRDSWNQPFSAIAAQTPSELLALAKRVLSERQQAMQEFHIRFRSISNTSPETSEPQSVAFRDNKFCVGDPANGQGWIGDHKKRIQVYGDLDSEGRRQVNITTPNFRSLFGGTQNALQVSGLFGMSETTIPFVTDLLQSSQTATADWIISQNDNERLLRVDFGYEFLTENESDAGTFLRATYILDPAKNFCPVQYTLKSSLGRDRCRTWYVEDFHIVNNERTNSKFWFPKTMFELDHKRAIMTNVYNGCEVLELNVAPPFHPSIVFDFQIPEGAFVRDLIQNKEYVQQAFPRDTLHNGLALHSPLLDRRVHLTWDLPRELLKQDIEIDQFRILDSNNKLMMLDVGSDDGLKVGTTIQIVQPTEGDPSHILYGSARVLDIQRKTATAKLLEFKGKDENQINAMIGKIIQSPIFQNPKLVINFHLAQSDSNWLALDAFLGKILDIGEQEVQIILFPDSEKSFSFGQMSRHSKPLVREKMSLIANYLNQQDLIKFQDAGDSISQTHRTSDSKTGPPVIEPVAKLNQVILDINNKISLQEQKLKEVVERGRFLTTSLQPDPETSKPDPIHFKVAAIEAQNYLNLKRPTFEEGSKAGNRLDVMNFRAKEDKEWVKQYYTALEKSEKGLRDELSSLRLKLELATEKSQSADQEDVSNLVRD